MEIALVSDVQCCDGEGPGEVVEDLQLEVARMSSNEG